MLVEKIKGRGKTNGKGRKRERRKMGRGLKERLDLRDHLVEPVRDGFSVRR